MEAALFGIIEKVYFLLNSLALFFCCIYLPVYISILVYFPLALKVYTRLACGVCRSYRRLEGLTVIVTGGNSGIGLEVAKDLARRGAKVILACRSLDKGRAALDEIRRETGSSELYLKHLDLSSFSSVRTFVKEIHSEEPRLDILINNAGTWTTEKVLTEDKLEVNFQTNYYGPFLLTILLLDLLRSTKKGRIVNVSSSAHWLVRKFKLDNLNSERRWQPYKVHFRTKLASIIFTKELSRRLRENGTTDTTINGAQPGVVRTGLFWNVNKVWYFRLLNTILMFFGKNVMEGAQTTIHVAVSEELNGISGQVYDDCQKAWTSGRSKDINLAKQLWYHSVKVVGLKPGEIVI